MLLPPPFFSLSSLRVSASDILPFNEFKEELRGKMNVTLLRAEMMKKSLKVKEMMDPTPPTDPSHASSGGCEKSKGKRPRKEGGDSSPPTAFLALKWADRAPKVHDVISQLYSQADDAYFDEQGQAAVDAMYDNYIKAGVAMTVLGERYKMGSLQEASVLHAELNQVRNECHQLKQDLRRVQSDLSLARAEHEEAIKADKAEIANLKDKLKSAISSKYNLQRELEATKQELVEVRDQMSTYARRNKLYQKEIIEAWKQTQACEDYKNEIRAQAYVCAVNHFVENMRMAFSRLRFGGVLASGEGEV